MRPPSLEQLDAVLFDAGGTLIELDFAYIAGCAREHGVEVAPDALRRGEVAARALIDRGARRRRGMLESDADRRFTYFGAMLEGAGVAPERLGPLAERLEAAHADANLWRVVIEGAAETLAALRARGLPTAVVSNADGRVEATLDAVGLATHLHLVVDSHLEGVEKPDPAIFQRALERLGIEPGRALYVGDIYAIDAVGARAAGMIPVLLDPFGAYGSADVATLPSLRALLGETRS